MNRFSEASSNHRVVRGPPPPGNGRLWEGVVSSIFCVQHAVCCRRIWLDLQTLGFLGRSEDSHQTASTTKLFAQGQRCPRRKKTLNSLKCSYPPNNHDVVLVMIRGLSPLLCKASTEVLVPDGFLSWICPFLPCCQSDSRGSDLQLDEEMAGDLPSERLGLPSSGP